MTLPNDIARCLGRDLLPDAGKVICPRRETCARYLEIGRVYAAFPLDGRCEHYIPWRPAPRSEAEGSNKSPVTDTLPTPKGTL